MQIVCKDDMFFYRHFEVRFYNIHAALGVKADKCDKCQSHLMETHLEKGAISKHMQLLSNYCLIVTAPHLTCAPSSRVNNSLTIREDLQCRLVNESSAATHLICSIQVESNPLHVL